MSTGTSDWASHFSPLSLLWVSRVSCVGAQQGLDRPSFSRGKTEMKTQIIVAKQLLAHAHIFTLGNNKHASLRRIAGLEIQWFSLVLHCDYWEKQVWDFHFWKTCEVQILFNPHIQTFVIRNVVMWKQILNALRDWVFSQKAATELQLLVLDMLVEDTADLLGFSRTNILG